MNKLETFNIIAISVKNIDENTIKTYYDEIPLRQYLGKFYVDVKAMAFGGEENNIIDIRIGCNNNNNDSLVIVSLRKLAKDKINLLKDLLKANDVQIKEHDDCVITKFL